MRTIQIKKGLKLPYRYLGDVNDHRSHTIRNISLSGFDYPFKPNLVVEVGDSVRRGQAVFTTKHDPRIAVTSPVNGRITGVHRGDKRALIAVSIQSESTEAVATSFLEANVGYNNREILKEYLAQNGAWVYLRTRPFNEIPELDEEPSAIFINAMDTRPGSVGMKPIVRERYEALNRGLDVLASLTKNKLFFCQSERESWEKVEEKSWSHGASLEKVAFSGSHPSGLSSTHIHFLRPASLKHKVWAIPVDLVADIGELLSSGVLPNKTTVSLSGPYWEAPCMLTTILGSKVSELVEGYMPKDKKGIHISRDKTTGKNPSDYSLPQSSFRIVSGSILHGWGCEGAWDFLGRFHNQISLLKDSPEREFLDWIRPGWKKFSITRSAFGHLFHSLIEWNTKTNGSPRALVPIGNYERVLPMDILPTQLLRALITGDWEEAIDLGALELEEEDMSLLTYVCPGKMDFGPMLKQVLKEAKKELV